MLEYLSPSFCRASFPNGNGFYEEITQLEYSIQGYFYYLPKRADQHVKYGRALEVNEAESKGCAL